MLNVKRAIGDLKLKLEKKTPLNPTIGNFSLRDLCNENGIRAMNFSIFNDLTISSACFEYKNIQKRIDPIQ